MVERRFFWLGVCLLPSWSACGAKTQQDGGSDTSTDWVRECSEDVGCDDDLSCACGICSRECDSNADCHKLSPDAQCAETPSSCRESGSICVADASFSWLTDVEDAECIAVIDTAGCCLPVVAVTRRDANDNPCLIEAAGADLSQDFADVCPPNLCPANCVDLDLRVDFSFVAEASDGGDCQLAPACEDGTCPGSPCDPRVGCQDGLVCSGTVSGCDSAGVCRTVPDTVCAEVFDPVCGCDGITYDNPCNAKGRALEHDGECDGNEPG